jgi:hypothetical protein
VCVLCVCPLSVSTPVYPNIKLCMISVNNIERIIKLIIFFSFGIYPIFHTFYFNDDTDHGNLTLNFHKWSIVFILINVHINF